MSLFSRLKASAVAAVAVSGNNAPAPKTARQQRLEAEHAAQQKMRGEPDKDFDAILSSLDKQYLDPKYDPVALLLEGLPMADSHMDQYLNEQKLRQQDLLDAVSARLGREVVANYAAFIEGMRQIAEIDMDVSRASIHVSNSLRKLGSAKESLVTGTLGIAYRRRRRERLGEVRSHLGFIQSLVRVEDVVAKACAEHKYADAVKAVASNLSKAYEPSTNEFGVIKGLRSRLDAALDQLQERLLTVLDGQCLQFKPAVYGALLQAYKELDTAGIKANQRRHASAVGPEAGAGGQGAERRAERAGTTVGDDMLGGFDADSAHLPGGHSDDAGAGRLGDEATGMGGRGQSLLQEVGSSIAGGAGSASAPGITSVPGVGSSDSHMAALPTRVQAAATKASKVLSKEVIIDLLLKKLRAQMDGSSQSAADSSAAAALKAVERAVLEANGEAMSSSDGESAEAAADYLKRRSELKQRTFTDLAAMLPPEDIPAACMRVAAAMAHAMHQHYLLTQWHRSPFDARAASDEGEFLHRCASDEDDPDEETAAKDPTAHSRAKGPDAASPLSITVKGLRPFLLRGRIAVWQHMQQRYGSMLFSAVGSAGVRLPLERLCQCLILSRDVMTTGLEYVGHHVRAADGSSGAGAAAGMDSDPCSTMRGSLRLLCSQYIDAVSRDSFERLVGMLAKEDWQRVPLTSADFVNLLSTAQAGLRAAFPKAALAAVEGAIAAIMGTDATLGSPTVGSAIDDADASARNNGEEAESPCRCYSDGVSLFSSWMDRGNPFGHVALVLAGQDHATIAGATVAPVPRPNTSNDADDDDDDDEEDGVQTPGEGAAARRAYARLMRRIHGDGYHLDVGLGRGPGLGFGVGIGGDADNAVAAAATRGGDDSDADSSDDESEILDEEAESSDSDDSDEGEGNRRLRKGEDEGGTFAGASGSAGPFAAIFAGQHQHVVTASVLNGFARAVGKHVLLMEVLPSVATDAFIGLARLYELYLYTVATLFLRPAAQKQLFDVVPPTPGYLEKERDPNSFDYVDGSAFTVAARIGAAVCDAREAEHRTSGAHKMLRRVHGAGGYGGSTSGGLDSSFTSDGGRSGAGRRAGGRSGADLGEAETVTIDGVTLHVRGLPAMAQSQGFSPDYYLTGAGAEAAAVVQGGSYLHEGVYVTLRRALQQIGSELVGHSISRAGAASSSILASGVFTYDGPTAPRGFCPDPYVRLKAGIELEGEAAGFGIVERCVAVESLDFMMDVLARLRTRIEAHVPPSHVQALGNFYTRGVLCATQLRGLMYHSLVPRVLPECGAIPNMIAGVKWDAVRDAMDPSPHTVELGPFVTRATAMLNDKVKSSGLPAVSRFGVWSTIVSHVLDRFVEGYSRVKKCSVPGRGLMSLDAATVYAACVKAGPVVPSCLSRDKSHVDAYVAAFYYDNETDLLGWVTQQRAAYPLRHMRAVLLNGIGPSLKKKALKDLQAAIEALYLLPMPEEMARQLAMEKGVTAVGGGLVAMGHAMTGGLGQ